MPRPDPARVFRNEGTYQIVGHIWRQDTLGHWERFLVRRHQWSRRAVVSSLHLVDKQKSFCLACLSTAVQETGEITVDSTGITDNLDYLCLTCGVRWRIIPDDMVQ